MPPRAGCGENGEGPKGGENMSEELAAAGIEIQHWPSVGMLNLILRRDVPERSGLEVAPGVVFHFAGEPDDLERALVRIEIDASSGAKTREEAIFERYDDAGEVVFRALGEEAAPLTGESSKQERWRTA